MAMRPHPEISTDILYSPFPVEDLVNIGNAMGFSDLRYVTTATLKPERVLYHACLNGLQTYVKLKNLDEKGRAMEIAQAADDMFPHLLQDYMEHVHCSHPGLLAQMEAASMFCDHIESIEGQRPWNKVRFDTAWPADRYPSRWQKKAIETYAIIRERIENGEYTPREGENAGTLTCYWSQRNLEYKHYRDIARGMVEMDISEIYTQDEMLSMYPAHQRVVTMVIGGMGSGKTVLTNEFINNQPESRRGDFILHNADYLKMAMYDSAVREGVLPAHVPYSGPEVQYESSNALYEGTRKRDHLARQIFMAPNAVLNSIGLGPFELSEAIASGGHVIAHHIFVRPDDAYEDALRRAEEAGGRMPSRADLDWSATASAKSLLMLIQPEYRLANIRTHLYRREAGSTREHYATIDAQTMQLFVHDMDAMTAMCDVIAPGNPSFATRDFLGAFSQAGFDITLTLSRLKTCSIATLTARDGALRICDDECFTALPTGRTILEMLQLDGPTVHGADACPVPYLGEVLNSSGKLGGRQL